MKKVNREAEIKKEVLKKSEEIFKLMRPEDFLELMFDTSDCKEDLIFKMRDLVTYNNILIISENIGLDKTEKIKDFLRTEIFTNYRDQETNIITGLF